MESTSVGLGRLVYSPVPKYKQHSSTAGTGKIWCSNVNVK